MDPTATLRDLEKQLRDEFADNRRVMSFDEYFELFATAPRLHARSSAEYLRDCMRHYGTAKLRRSGRTVTRYRLFDCPWDDSDRRHRLVGQEEAQHEFYRLLNNFVQAGRVSKLLLLHGPNGSAKSSFVQCLHRGLEHYSTLDEGAIYTFGWVFPNARVAKKRLGFGAKEREALKSFAYLEDEDVDARLGGDLRDHPLLLLPKRHRRALFASLIEQGKLDPEHTLPELLIDGDLSPRSRMIFDALLAAYQGDVQRVLQHVQIERFYYSQRYRTGSVTVEPQMHVDAQLRQITMDQRLQALPPSLKGLTLFEPHGDLVDANRGMVEYNDLLKKPLEAYKYLLATCEKGTVALPGHILHLDLVFVATSNEKHLTAFKQYEDFQSFKGRMELVKMPYIRDYRVEAEIYEHLIRADGLEAKRVPHVEEMLALWAVLTRLHRPDPEQYKTSVRDVVARLTPMEKADLYAGEREPRDLSPEQSRELRATLVELLAEGQATPNYEGASGASPRVMSQVMLNAAQSERYYGLSPLAIFHELRELVKLRTVHEFLKREPSGGYHDHEGFIEQVFDRWLDLVSNEVRTAMGLVSEEQYNDLFGRYILHVSYLHKGEKIYNERTGSSEPPDEKLMERLESIWDRKKSTDQFRRDLISRIGAWRIDHPNEDIDYRRLFPDLFEALERDYYEQQKQTVRKLSEHVLHTLRAERAPDDKHPELARISEEERTAASQTVDRLVADFGYPRESVLEIVAALVRHRYS